MKLNDFDLVHLAVARPVPEIQSDQGWGGAIAVLKTRLAKAWVGLYAAPPRHLPPML